MKIFRLIYPLILILITSCCYPHLGDFYYANEKKEYVDFSITDSISGRFNIGESYPREELQCWIDMLYSSKEYTVENIEFYLVAKNKIDSIKIKPNKFEVYSETESFKKWKFSSFDSIPIADRIVKKKEYYCFKQFWFDMPQIPYNDYDDFQLNLSITIRNQNQSIEKVIKQDFRRKRKLYLKNVWL